ncbi:MAG: response regulator, partial [Chitinophagaceae bacterium]
NSKKRFVNYTDLPAGDYIFQLAASGGDGIWSAEPVTLKINIVPSFWVSKYGYLLYAVLIVIAIFLQRRYTLMRLHVKHQLELDETKRQQEVKSYEDKMQFFTNISHELRTPLTLITSPIEQLVNTADLPARVNEKMVIVRKNAERLRHMIDQVLDVRKLELGKLELQKEYVNVKEFLQNIFLQFQDLVENKSIAFKIDVQFEQQVLIDVFKMEQVMINLLTNASKFTPEGGEIVLSGCRKENYLVISVCNSGTMLGAEERAKIFEPFYQVNGSNRHGTGLGLTISKSLVELHQGTIRVDSFRDENSGVPYNSFAIRLPLNVEKTPPQIIAGDQTALPGIEEQLLTTSKTVLRQSIVFVDDNEDLRNIFQEEFQSEYNVYTAANGREALKTIRKIKPAIIITDVMMPVMDGMVLCNAIKNDVAINDIPLIILTAKTTEQSRMAGLELMADDYISKPFSLRELHLKVRNIILKRSSLRTKINNDVILNPTVLNFESRDERIIKDAIAIIENNMDNADFSVEHLCKDANTSRPVLYRKIKELTGMSIQVFILDIRLKRAAQLLKTKSLSVSEVMFSTGFSSPSYFNKAFKNKFNSSPAQYNHQ